MKVLLAVPCGEDIVAQTSICLVALAASTKLAGAVFSVDGYIDRNHNSLASTALKMDCDAILFVDSDHEFPQDSLDRLIARRKDVVGCQYRMRQDPWELMPPTSGDLHGCQEVEWIPSGLMLVKTDVFRKVSFPWFPNLYGKSQEEFVGSDRSFCRKVKGLGGYSIWCDYDLSDKVTHIARVAMRRDGTFHSPGKQI